MNRRGIGDNGTMTPGAETTGSDDELEALERALEESDAAAAPEAAEEIARRLSDALDAVDPGEKGAAT